MSMMVNSVSNVSFRSNSQGPQVNVDELLSRQGAFSNPAQSASASVEVPAKKKSHSFAKFLAGSLATVAVIAGSLFAAQKFLPKVFDASKKFSDISALDKTMDKITGYVTTAIAKGGKAVEDAAVALGSKCADCWHKIFPKKS